MNTVLILRAAKGLLETKGWTQGSYAKDAEGNRVPPELAQATCFCALGAVRAAPYAGGRMQAMIALLRAIGPEWSNVPDFNDARGRTAAEVIAKFDEAIAAEEAKLAPLAVAA